MVRVTQDSVVDIPHEGGMMDEETIALDSLPPNEGDGIASQDKIASLEGRRWITRVGEAYA